MRKLITLAILISLSGGSVFGLVNVVGKAVDSTLVEIPSVSPFSELVGSVAHAEEPPDVEVIQTVTTESESTPIEKRILDLFR